MDLVLHNLQRGISGTNCCNGVSTVAELKAAAQAAATVDLTSFWSTHRI